MSWSRRPFRISSGSVSVHRRCCASIWFSAGHQRKHDWRQCIGNARLMLMLKLLRQKSASLSVRVVLWGGEGSVKGYTHVKINLLLLVSIKPFQNDSNPNLPSPSRAELSPDKLEICSLELSVANTCARCFPRCYEASACIYTFFDSR